MTKLKKQTTTYAVIALVAVALCLLVYALVSAAQRTQANARVQQMITDQATKAHADQLAWAARLPEVYTFSVVAKGKDKKTATSFLYTLVKNAQTMNKEAVVADEAGGLISVDQSDASIMTDGFKCFWKTPCSATATDASGDTIYASQEPTGNVYYYGLVKGKSIIRITAHQAMTHADLLAVVDSLKPATTAERQHIR